MENENLPLCPCGSGRLYEDCCYKVLENNKPLYFRGMMICDSNEVWHPIPNAKLACVIVGEESNKNKSIAKDLIEKSQLKKEFHKRFIDNYASFLESYEKLIHYFNKNHGEGADFQIDSLELREYWKSYLFTGRILLDFVGLHSRGCLNLKQKVGGLNERKINSLLEIIHKQSSDNPNLLSAEKIILKSKQALLDFIDLRNREKSHQDTIKEFPILNEFGIVKDGVIQGSGKKILMKTFAEISYNSIKEIVVCLLNITQ